MIGYQSILHQGWAICKHQGFNLDACPYPRNSQSAKEWIEGHFKAHRGEHWNTLAQRKPKKAKMDIEN